MDWNALGDDLWEILKGLSEIGPLGTAAAAVVAAIALSQKWKSDDRTAWWARVQWAADHSLSKDDEAQFIGTSALAAIRTNGSPSVADQELMQTIGQRSKKEEMAMGEAEQDNGGQDTVVGSDSEGGENADFP